MKLHIKKGDIVKVLSGNSKGSVGKVLSIIVDKNRATVEGANIIKKHIKPSANNPQGRIAEMEAPIHISNLMLVDPKTNEPTKTGRMLDESGKLVRYSKKTKEIIK